MHIFFNAKKCIPANGKTQAERVRRESDALVDGSVGQARRDRTVQRSIQRTEGAVSRTAGATAAGPTTPRLRKVVVPTENSHGLEWGSTTTDCSPGITDRQSGDVRPARVVCDVSPGETLPFQ